MGIDREPLNEARRRFDYFDATQLDGLVAATMVDGEIDLTAAAAGNHNHDERVLILASQIRMMAETSDMDPEKVGEAVLGVLREMEDQGAEYHSR